MADATVYIRKGEKLPIYGAETISSGTLTISSGATCTLYDRTGTAVSGLSAVSVTGYDNTALSTVRVWYVLDTSAAAITADRYTLTFAFTATGSDGIVRTFEPAVSIVVQSVSI